MTFVPAKFVLELSKYQLTVYPRSPSNAIESGKSYSQYVYEGSKLV